MKKTFALAMIVAIPPMLVACGTTVEVPPAHVGKLSTSSGLQAGIIQPSKLRLSDMCRICDSLILTEASDFAIKEEMPIFMQKDTLNLKVEIRGTVAISSDEKNIEKIFSRVPAEPLKDSDRVSVISMNKVYLTYAQPIIRETTRTVITRYSIQRVMERRDSIGQEIQQAVRERLKEMPITVVQFGLADVQPPSVIVEAQEKAKTRQIAIEQAEADKQVRVKQAEGNLEVAFKEQQVELKQAETQVLVDRKLSDVSPVVITQRSLMVLSELAKSENKVFFLPLEMFRNPALLVGVTNSDMNQPLRRTAEAATKEK